MPSLSTPVQERSVITRAGLLTAVVECLTKFGYGGTTFRAVAKWAGVSPGALQHHFRARDRMIIAATEFIFEGMVRDLHRLSARAVQERGADAEAREIVTTLWRFYGGDMNTAVLEVVVGTRGNRKLRSQINQIRDRVVAAYLIPWKKLMAHSCLSEADQADLIQFTISTLRGLALTLYYRQHDSRFFRRQLRILAGIISTAIATGELFPLQTRAT